MTTTIALVVGEFWENGFCSLNGAETQQREVFRADYSAGDGWTLFSKSIAKMPSDEK